MTEVHGVAGYSLILLARIRRRRTRLHLFQPPRADSDGSIVRQSIYDRCLDMGETILDEVCNLNNVSLPHKLLHGANMKQRDDQATSCAVV